MTGPLEYESPRPARRWSILAILAFIFSWIGPLVAGRRFASDFATSPLIFAGSIIWTAIAGALLCMIAFMFADVRRVPRRGRGLAVAGVFVSLAWIGAPLLTFAFSDYFGWFLRVFL